MSAQLYIVNRTLFTYHANPERKSLTQKQGEKALRALREKGARLRAPAEALWLSWETGEGTPYLLITPVFQITAENAVQCLTPEALASVLPYILSGGRLDNRAVPELYHRAAG